MTTDSKWAFYNAGATVDLVTIIWILVFVTWVVATGNNFLTGTFELADIPTGLAAVLVAVPLSKGAVEAARALKGS